jgi:hypothetical protein
MPGPSPVEGPAASTGSGQAPDDPAAILAPRHLAAPGRYARTGSLGSRRSSAPALARPRRLALQSCRW